jgi:hypothetical protein
MANRVALSDLLPQSPLDGLLSRIAKMTLSIFAQLRENYRWLTIPTTIKTLET